MVYATSTDLETHFGAEQVLLAADRDGSGVVDTGVIDRALLNASEEIDSYLVKQYSLPLTTVPGILLMHCCEMAMYRMSTYQAGSLTEEKRKRYEDAIAWLKLVAAGKVGLDDDSGTVEATQQVVEIAEDIEQERLFTRTSLRSLF